MAFGAIWRRFLIANWRAEPRANASAGIYDASFDRRAEKVLRNRAAPQARDFIGSHRRHVLSHCHMPSLPLSQEDNTKSEQQYSPTGKKTGCVPGGDVIHGPARTPTVLHSTAGNGSRFQVAELLK